MKHKVASKNFLKLSLLYVKNVGPTTFTIENLAPVAKSLDTPDLDNVSTTAQWAGRSELWKKAHSPVKNSRLEVAEGLLEVHGKGESDDIKKSKLYTKSGAWCRISLFRHGGLKIQNLPFSEIG